MFRLTFYYLSSCQLGSIELIKIFLPRPSGLSSFARAARPAFAAPTRRVLKPATSAFRFPLSSRLASTSSVGDGKIYQVSLRKPRLANLCRTTGNGTGANGYVNRSSVLSSMVSKKPQLPLTSLSIAYKAHDINPIFA